MITIGLVLYNEEKHLSLIEENLRLFCLRPETFSVVVVNNASSDNTALRIEELKSKFTFSTLHRAHNNLGEARQNVIDAAQSEWVGFIDGDCLISEKWLAAVQQMHELMPEDVGAFGGPWRPTGLYKKHYEALFDTPVGSFSLPQFAVGTLEVQVAHIPTANIIYKKAAVLSAGGFLSKYAYVGEDLDLSYRLVKKGKKLLMSSALPVDHYLPESLQAWAKKIFTYGRGRMQVAHDHSQLLDRILLLPLLFLTTMVLSWFFVKWSLVVLYAALMLVVAVLLKKQSTVSILWTLIVITHFSYALGMACEGLYIVFYSLIQKKKIDRLDSEDNKLRGQQLETI
ncbi:MAG: glycosyltransferase [Bdellovibrionaceae bacterium]|nr:glycosyltransferase [Pseudobdellovibrionaceae bacterium]